MSKKGFTLVELLAVIAILAILVIIALPNVLGMFNQAKKDTFTTETKEMVKITQQQYLATFGKYTKYAVDKSLPKGRCVTGMCYRDVLRCCVMGRMPTRSYWIT